MHIEIINFHLLSGACFSAMKRRREKVEPSEEQRLLFVSVKHCARELDDILQGARRKSEKNSEYFARSHISMLHRGIHSYAHMYERLNISTRRQLDESLSQHFRCDDVQDANDDIQETEGLWNNFLTNLDKELGLYFDPDCNDSHKYDGFVRENDKVDLSSISFLDWKSRHRVTLQQIVKPHRLLLVLVQPVYLPAVTLKWYFDQLQKHEENFKLFKLSVALVMWGAEEEESSPSNSSTDVDINLSTTPSTFFKSSLRKDPMVLCKEWLKSVKLPQLNMEVTYLYDQDRVILKKKLLRLESGLVKIWGYENLEFYGQQESAGLKAHPPPQDMCWTKCIHLGGALLLSQTGKVLISQPSASVSNLPEVDSLNDLALSTHARLLGKTEDEIRDQIRQERVYSCPPDMTRLQFEPTSGLYYDPKTGFYYNTSTQYYLDPLTNDYVYWDEQKCKYISAKPIYEAAEQQRLAMQQYCDMQIAAYDAAINEAKRRVQEEEEAEKARRMALALQKTIEKTVKETKIAYSDLKPPGT